MLKRKVDNAKNTEQNVTEFRKEIPKFGLAR